MLTMSPRDKGALAERKAVSRPEKPMMATATDASAERMAIQSATLLTGSASFR